jgi:hypothetical protein
MFDRVQRGVFDLSNVEIAGSESLGNIPSYSSATKNDTKFKTKVEIAVVTIV